MPQKMSVGNIVKGGVCREEGSVDCVIEELLETITRNKVHNVYNDISNSEEGFVLPTRTLRERLGFDESRIPNPGIREYSIGDYKLLLVSKRLRKEDELSYNLLKEFPFMNEIKDFDSNNKTITEIVNNDIYVNVLEPQSIVINKDEENGRESKALFSRMLIKFFLITNTYYELAKQLSPGFPDKYCGRASIDVTITLNYLGYPAFRAVNSSLDHAYIIIPYLVKNRVKEGLSDEEYKKGVIIIDPTSEQLWQDDVDKVEKRIFIGGRRTIRTKEFDHYFYYSSEYSGFKNMYPNEVIILRKRGWVIRGHPVLERFSMKPNDFFSRAFSNRISVVELDNRVKNLSKEQDLLNSIIEYYQKTLL